MNIEELIKLAESGDSDAMVELGDYYKAKGDFSNFEIAAQWYEKAAEKDDPFGAMYSMVLQPVIALVNQAVGDWRTALSAWELAKKRSIETLETCELMGEKYDLAQEKEIALETLENYKYGAGICYFGLKEDKNAVNVLNDARDIKSQVLRGVCAFRSEDYKNAYNDLKMIENVEYQKMQKEKYDEHVYSLAARQLSGIYRLGFSGMVSSDLNKAVYVLETSYSNINDSECKSIVKKELDRYQKKLFGGYKYIG